MTLPPLYPIVDAAFPAAWPIAKAIGALGRAGCTLVQIRAKELSSRAFYDWALEAVAAGREAGVRMIVNDRADLALLVGAAGVHLGQEDLSPEGARRILGSGAVVGVSTHTPRELALAEASAVDYVAIGPVFRTTTKPTDRATLGCAGVATARAATRKPLVAIGGITAETALSVIEAGADSVAIISALMEAPDLEAAARGLLSRFTGSRT